MSTYSIVSPSPSRLLGYLHYTALWDFNSLYPGCSPSAASNRLIYGVYPPRLLMPQHTEVCVALDNRQSSPSRISQERIRCVATPTTFMLRITFTPATLRQDSSNEYLSPEARLWCGTFPVRAPHSSGRLKRARLPFRETFFNLPYPGSPPPFYISWLAHLHLLTFRH